MIFLKNKNLCFLEKPKCASTSLKQSILNSVSSKETYITNKNLIDVNYNYNDPNYRHCNLASAQKRLRHMSLLNEETTFISLLREPIELINSMYYYDLNSRFGNKKFIYKTLEEMISTIHYKQFTDSYFFNCEGLNLKLFDMYDTIGLNNYLNQKYGLNLSFPHINKNKQNKSDLFITLEVEEKIKKDFYLYYTLKG